MELKKDKRINIIGSARTKVSKQSIARRGEAAPFVLSMYIRAALQQQMADFAVAFLNGEMQRSLIAESTYQKESIECRILDHTT